MFNNKEKSSTPSEKLNSTNATLISAGTVLKGNVQSDTDLRVDGTVHGNINCTAKVILGASGYVEGDIEGTQADINGRVLGNLYIKDLLQLRGQCNVQGNIITNKLQVDPAAIFNGQCQMTTEANIVQMSPNHVQEEAQ